MGLSMQLYSFDFDEKSKKYTTKTIAPDEQLYKYSILPMGIKVSPNEAHSIIKVMAK